MTTITKLQNRHEYDAPASGSCCAAAHAEIRLTAYQHYERSGKINGRDVRDWLEAESSVKARLLHEKHVCHESHERVYIGIVSVG